MENTEKVALAKAVIKFVVGTSVGTVVSKAIKQNLEPKNLSEELQIVVGAYVLAGMASDKALDWADAKYEETRQKLIDFETARKDRSEQKKK